MTERNPGLDTLLLLDGENFFADAEGNYWVKFVVKRVPASSARPHGLHYSLTLHSKDGTRLLGFDNAHTIKTRAGPGAAMPLAQDHKHRGASVRSYPYSDAATLLADFWGEVDNFLRTQGEKP